MLGEAKAREQQQPADIHLITNVALGVVGDNSLGASNRGGAPYTPLDKSSDTSELHNASARQ